MKTKSLNDIIAQSKRIIDKFFPEETYPNGSRESVRMCVIFEIVSRATDNIASLQWQRCGCKWYDGWSDADEQFPRDVYANMKPEYSYGGVADCLLSAADTLRQAA